MDESISWFENLVARWGAVDVGFGVFLIFFVIRGFIRGFSKEVAGLIMMIIVAAGGWTLYRPISKWLLENTRISKHEAADLIALSSSVLCLYVLLRLGGWVLSRIIDYAFNDKIERPGGLIAGGVQGLAWISLFVLAVGVSGNPYLNQKVIVDSRIGSFLASRVSGWWEKVDGALISPSEDKDQPKPSLLPEQPAP
jgi:uncharacterized membrane protein required for colicin V production